MIGTVTFPAVVHSRLYCGNESLHESRYAGLWRPTLRALLIRHPWIDMILDSEKTWEIRGSRTSFRETIGLIASRSGTVIGVCDLVDCIGPLTDRELRVNAHKAGMRREEATSGYP